MTFEEKRNIEDLSENCFIIDLNNDIKKLTKNLLQTVNIKLPDAIIAATAIYLDLPLLTFDAGFKAIPGLNLFILE